MLLIKLLGVLLLVFAGGAYGFLAASLLEKRATALREIHSKTNALKERIRGDFGELPALLNLCYKDCPHLEIKGARVRVLAGILRAEDIELLEEFFAELGALDKEGEYSRICVFQSILNAQYEKARREATQKSRLIKTAGISVGLGLGILII